MEVMLLGIVERPIVALEILYSLEHTQTVLLSCASTVPRREFLILANRLKSKDWTAEEQDEFALKFSAFVPGSWLARDVVGEWDELVKVSQRRSHEAELMCTDAGPYQQDTIAPVNARETKISSSLAKPNGPGCSCSIDDVVDKCEQMKKEENGDAYHCHFDGTTWEDTAKEMAIVVL